MWPAFFSLYICNPFPLQLTNVIKHLPGLQMQAAIETKINIRIFLFSLLQKIKFDDPAIYMCAYTLLEGPEKRCTFSDY